MKHTFAHFPVRALEEKEKRTEKALRQILRKDQISSRWPDRLSYGRDCNSKATLWVRQGKVKYPPQWIVWPETSAEVSAVLKFAREKNLPVVPFGGGSGVCGGTWALGGGIVLDVKRMDRLLALDGKAMTIEVETGINGEILERELGSRGYTLGHFPSSIYAATLGGYLACRSAGQFSSLYGKIEDMVQGLEVVLPTGEIIRLDSVRNRPRTWDFKEIFLGSEGTLGVITKATLAIHPKPEVKNFFAFQFRNLERGITAAREIMQSGLRPAVLRVYDPLDSLLATSYKGENPREGIPKILSELWGSQFHTAGNLSLKLALRRPRWINSLVDLLPSSSMLIVGFVGSKASVKEKMEFCESLCKKGSGKSLGEEMGRYWYEHRYSVSYKLSPYFDQGFFADTMETATTWNQLIPLYHGVRNALVRDALVFAHFSHAYPTGCSIYFSFLAYDREGEASERRYDEIWRKALDACLQYGGTLSHHHGIGVLKASHLRKEWGEAFEWLCKLKRSLDPENLMNPGKLGFPLHWG
jgi:alkyldihydroxyacetonephosphate synthase